MKVLIVSDSHGLTSELSQIREMHPDMDLMIHCGDSELQADHDSLRGYAAVRGNCDFEAAFPEDRVEEAGGLRFFVTHGHRYSVKSTLMNLSYKAREMEADIVCFGHSHGLGAEMSDGILFINPGSIWLPRGRKEKTYVILEARGKDVTLDVYDLSNGKIPELTQNFSLVKSE
ncbi:MULTISPECIES: metallophosphoesterase [Cytobacillus]|uniref:Phosphoesterase n=1 Tax=Cytobacillus oceanisediminis 2691 TaxID=1196031 RepID=A0A160MGB5_9BACI|nr:MULTISPECIES: metallophosphoesterase [Cytobacillus]MBY0155312.1 metallophosphoesterase [Cytobacillus firmus]AND41698.1 metallophosphatase [Cytobacillus oceanisediminis 2691]MBU8730458.1 metallophosphoesterase [Cytobacillus oceanisediminis]MCM3242452.1 metallophosphoesterase [Cytobacillus oceanisediminis]MCM3393059.1 metallophosphoesterase [Cytobacillus oceanisediminis]